MVGHLTFGKKKYEGLSDSDKEAFTNVFNDIKTFQDRLMVLIDEDTKSFGIFMDALKLPKDTDEEKSIRLQKMEDATKEIIKVPYEIAKVSLQALKSLDIIIKLGNKNAITDVGVAAILLDSAVEGACLNVKINLPGLSDEALVNSYNEDVKNFITEANKIRVGYLNTIHSSL